jgi:hypothetical protein
MSVFRLGYAPIWDLDIWEVKFSKITRISKNMKFVDLILDMYLSSSRGYLNRGDDFNSSMM